MSRCVIGNVKMEVSRNGGTSWTGVAGNVPNQGTFNWTVTGPASSRARIRVSSTSTSTVADASNADFTIPGSLTVTVPRGETWGVGTRQTIRWTSVGLTGNVRIEASRDGGVLWFPIGGSAANSGFLNWTVTGPASGRSLIRVSSLAVPDARDTGYFTSVIPRIAVASPNGGETWPFGTIQPIRWTSTGLTGNVRIEVSRDGGRSWAVVSSNTPDDGAFDWRVTGPAAIGQARIRITSATLPTVTDTSDSNFDIVATSSDRGSSVR